MLTANEKQELELLRKQTQTVEQTGKKWKATQLIGGLLSAIGVAGTFYYLNTNLTVFVTFLDIGAIGILTCLVSKLGAWWYHA